MLPKTCKVLPTSVRLGSEENIAQEMAVQDKFFLWLYVAHWLAAVTLIPFGYGTYMLGAVGAGIFVAIAAAAYHFFKSKLTCRLVMGMLMMGFSALFIQQTMGRIETHFHVFGGMAFLLVYRDWRVILAAVVTVALHHGFFTWLQLNEFVAMGTPIIVFNYDCGWDIVLLHAAWVIFEGAVLVYLSHHLFQEKVRNTVFAEQIRYVADEEAENYSLLPAYPGHKAEAALLEMVNGFFEQRGRALSYTQDSARFISDESATLFATSTTMSDTATHLRSRLESLVSGLNNLSGELEQTTHSSEQASENIAHISRQAGNINKNAADVSASSVILAGHISKGNDSLALVNKGLADTSRDLSIAAEKSVAGRDATEATGKQMAVLIEYAGKIDEVVKLINKIADQTNLLALNAAIEAAKAGTVGEGFAVVAGEIKALATQTTEATQLIAEQVARIQTECSASYQSIGEASTLIRDLNQLVIKVSRSVEDQSEQFNHISHSMEESNRATQNLAGKVGDISTDVGGLAENIGQAASGAQAVAVSLESIAELSRSMKQDLTGVNQMARDTTHSADEVKKAAEEMRGKARGLSAVLKNGGEEGSVENLVSESAA